MPVTLIVLAFLLSWFYKKHRRFFLLAGLILLLVFTNYFLSNALLRWWEVPPTPLSELPNYEVGIVLGGITSDKEPRDRVHVSGAADRILHAMHLYRIGKIDKILISGGSGKILKDSIPEAELLKEILLLSKVPESDIIIEASSRNTHENASFSAEILNEKYVNEKYLLITSAFHMRRAEACFKKAGLEVDPFSVDMKGNEFEFTPDELIIPTSAAIGNWEVVIREIVGMLAYKVSGYI
ncbi:YdcF family protein [Catalinimonas sp. 4WD22]|uniref:YdcF family protein n=1 Tax=Catalinimonas locisalis TaxID=3133978 RepID=UPI0031018E02